MNREQLSSATDSFLSAFADSQSAQQKVLLQDIVCRNTTSEFGKRHGFTSVRSIADFRHAVPLLRYENFRADIQRMLDGEPGVLTSEPVRRFFVTSGSTSTPKFIPVTPSFIRAKSKAFQMFWKLVCDAYPKIKGGDIIFNFSDMGRDRRNSAGVVYGSESSFWNACWRGTGGTARSPFPREIADIGDAEARYYTIARILLETDVRALMTLNPSTMLMLSEIIRRNAPRLLQDIRNGGISTDIEVTTEVSNHLREQFTGNERRARELERALATGEPVRARQLWPDLQVVISWRSPMVRPYLELLNGFLSDLGTRDYLTMASEGVLTIPFQDHRSGGILPIHTHFFEFIPEEEMETDNPSTLLAHELKVDGTYVVVLTTSSGLYRYNIEDVVRVRQFNGSTPVVEFLHRAGQTCSLTGEKLTESQVAVAVQEAASRSGFRVRNSTLCPIARPHPHYVLVGEIDEGPLPSTGAEFVKALDAELGIRNVEYHSKRSSRRLGAPEFWVVAPGSYASLRQERIAQGANDAQVKISCLTRDFEWCRRFDVVKRFSCGSQT